MKTKVVFTRNIQSSQELLNRSNFESLMQIYFPSYLSSYIKTPMEKDLDFGNHEAQNVVLRRHSEKVEKATISGHYQLDYQKGNVHDLTLSGHSQITIANIPENASALSVKLTSLGNYNLSWDENVAWADQAPELKSGESQWVVLVTSDGQTFQGFIPG